MTVHQQQLMQIFIREGYSVKGAAAIDGGVSGESGVSLDTTVFRVVADHDSGGIAEWRLNRKTKMIAFCQARGKPITDFESQCMFIIYELTDPKYLVLNQDLKQGLKTITTLCWDFVIGYERPDMAVAHMDDIRVPQALKCYDDYQVALKAKGAVVVGGAAGGGAIVTSQTGLPPSISIALGIIWLISWLLGILVPKPKQDGKSTVHLPPTPTQDTPTTQVPPAPVLTPLEKFRRDDALAKAALVQRQKSYDELKASAEVLNVIIANESGVTVIDHTPKPLTSLQGPTPTTVLNNEVKKDE